MNSVYMEGNETFLRIWSALTQDHMMKLLSRLEPKPHGSRELDVMCPGCGLRRAFAYAPKDSKGPHIRCNRKNECGYDQTLWQFLKAENAGDGTTTFNELIRVTGVSPDDTQKRQYGRPAPPTYTPTAPPLAVTVDVPADMDERQAEYLAAFPGSPAAEYLRSRGVSDELAEAGGFGYSAAFVVPVERDGVTRPWNSGPRLTYPLRNKAGEITTIEGRALDPAAKARIVSYGPKDTGLFFPSGKWSKDGLHLVEGAIDACALAQIGLNAAGKSGTAVPEWLPFALSLRDVCAAYDADKAGDKAADDFASKGAKWNVRTKRVRPCWPESLGQAPEGFKDWGDLLRHSEGAVRAAYAVATGKHTPKPAEAPENATRGQKPAIPDVPLTPPSAALHDARTIDDDLTRILAAMDRGEGLGDSHSFDDLAETAADLLKPLQQVCDKLAGHAMTAGFHDPARSGAEDCITRHTRMLARLLQSGDMLPWRPESPAWRAFAAGDRGARVILADGRAVVVIPDRAKVPASVTEYIRPAQFWDAVSGIDSSGWQIVPRPVVNAPAGAAEGQGAIFMAPDAQATPSAAPGDALTLFD